MPLFLFSFSFDLMLDAGLFFLFLSGDETSQNLHAASLINLSPLDHPLDVIL